MSGYAKHLRGVICRGMVAGDILKAIPAHENQVIILHILAFTPCLIYSFNHHVNSLRPTDTYMRQ